ncbi:MAG: hypothetical protein GXP63_00780 [DPANN group archaeon]|nr:hypothetical protein [DPANN group archaeon]
MDALQDKITFTNANNRTIGELIGMTMSTLDPRGRERLDVRKQQGAFQVIGEDKDILSFIYAGRTDPEASQQNTPGKYILEWNTKETTTDWINRQDFEDKIRNYLGLRNEEDGTEKGSEYFFG